MRSRRRPHPGFGAQGRREIMGHMHRVRLSYVPSHGADLRGARRPPPAIHPMPRPALAEWSVAESRADRSESASEQDGAALRPLLAGIELALAAARAAKLRLGPDTSKAADATIRNAERVLDLLAQGVRQGARGAAPAPGEGSRH